MAVEYMILEDCEAERGKYECRDGNDVYDAIRVSMVDPNAIILRRDDYGWKVVTFTIEEDY